MMAMTILRKEQRDPPAQPAAQARSAHDTKGPMGRAEAAVPGKKGVGKGNAVGLGAMAVL